MLDRLPALVAKLESEQAMLRADAVAWAAFNTDVLPSIVALQMHKAEKQAKADQCSARDRAVIELAAAGHSNTEIGRRIGLHRHTVARIVQRQLRQRQIAAEDGERSCEVQL